MDPAKLKVVELRSELAARGLDTKGNKAVLVERLKEAMDKEAASGTAPPTDKPTPAQVDSADDSQLDESMTEKDEQEVEKTEGEDEAEAEADESKQEEAAKSPVKQDSAPKPEAEAEEKDEEQEEKKEKNEENNTQEGGDVEMKEPESGDKENAEGKATPGKDGADKRGEKRKHSPSPARGPRRRSHSPVKEDEPIIDVDKVQLNWYDSDLHLQVDKENFMYAKPYHDGAFGYVWAGVRATHGVDSGKVCFEVKVVEELKWEDIIKNQDRSRRDKDRDGRKGKYDRDRHSSRNDDRSRKDKSKDRKKDEKVANGKDEENKEEKSEEKKEGEEKKDEDKPEEGGEKKEEVTEEKMEVDEKVEETKEEEKVEEEKKVEDEKKVEEEKKDEEKKEETATEASEEKQDEKEKEKDKEGAEEPKEPAPEPIPTHLFRVGWSVVTSGLQLGEEKYSYGYESSGKFVTDKEFQEYGIKFATGDVISSYVDFGETEITITFAVNGQPQPVAVTIPKEGLPEGFALFPHVLTKNYAFEVNLGTKDEPFFPPGEGFEDYVFLDKVEDMIAGPMRPEKRADCEIIMMCGLPASGKTHWVKKHIEENADKRYTVIGNTQLLEKMTVNGNPLKNSFKERWNVVIDKLQRCLNKLTDIAAMRRRNYIIDQGFKRRAVIVVVGEEEQTKRQQAKEAQEGKDVPGSAILEMKANMSLPRAGDWIEEITYAELNEADAKAMVQKYNTQGREAGFGPNFHSNWKRFKDNRGPPRWNDRRDYYRGGGGGGYRDNRSYNGSYDSRGGRPSSGWQPRSGGGSGGGGGGSGGGWRNDRRDRGPPPSRDWHNNNRRGSGGGRGRDFDRGVRDGRVSRPQRMGERGGGYNGNRSQGRQGGGGSWQQGWSGGGGASGGSWGGQGQYKQRFY